MKKEDIEKVLGQFGMITCRKNGCITQIHGKPKEIDSEDFLVFKDTFRRVIKFKVQNVVSFEIKDMLPAPTEYKGKSITWDNGRGFVTERNKEVDFDR